MHEIKTVDVKGVKLAYREYGSGDKYLLSTQNFFFKDSHMALLGQPPYDYHCFLVYMRGYGESEHIFDDTLKDYAKIWGEDLINKLIDCAKEGGGSDNITATVIY